MGSFLKGMFIRKRVFRSAGAAETARIAAGFAGGLKKGAIIGLIGELGAGKTRFIKGAAGFFKIKPEAIVSPTFNLVKEHKAGKLVLYHFDFYRLKDRDELDKIGYREYITDERAITFIEWPDRIAETRKHLDWVVEITHKGGNKREIQIYKLKVKTQKSKVKLKKGKSRA
jgi:tRNA threonylcarbamoyladenosine biosynthesis protein TsaE